MSAAELLFFLSLSVVSLNLYLWVLARAREAAPGRGGIFLSLAIYASVVPSLVAQLYLFELTGFKGGDVPFVDDHDHAVYFWVAGIFGGWALSFPFHRRTLIELGIIR
ncbi:MAG: hypothetical protein Q8N10_15855 [Phenylobacterium sp.]|uniref:hypothetical protein n=1 Tax=Phenylobacterium sp. TaxID=1871053 RepID=UPI00271D36A8|nr:hypothetical protein [Phenylobacterium sp.]MDO8912694.1 hypothetical protein [Phenylobacterium sp.]MDP3101960.1 hypothetical protein [Phenylobacterium sp.]